MNSVSEPKAAVQEIMSGPTQPRLRCPSAGVLSCKWDVAVE